MQTRSRVPDTETILDWPGYIDQSKQLSILHTLLAESLQKLPLPKQQELAPLGAILDKITSVKETYSFASGITTSMSSIATSSTTQLYTNNSNGTVASGSTPNPQTQINQEQYNANQENLPNSVGSNSNVSRVSASGERGVMRGVLTPSALEKNIFRYNDPTVLPLLSPNPNSNQGHNIHSNFLNPLQHKTYNKSTDSLQHSQSASSISSNMNIGSSVQHHLISSTQEQINKKTNNTSSNNNSNSNNYNSNKRAGYNQYNSSSSYYNTTSSSLRNGNSSTGNYLVGNNVTDKIGLGEIRASTLPRNPGTHENSDGPNTGNSSHLIQIGLDPSNAFFRKSPTPLMKTAHPFNGSRSKNLNGSQLSLLSDRSLNRNPCISYDVQGSSVGCHQPKTSNVSNMPLNLEDLDDLLNYADEQNSENKNSKKLQQSCMASTSGTQNSVTNANGGNKGSNISIGQMSHACSSGYQSIATQSQSSSPIELTSQMNNTHSNNANLDFPSSSSRDMAKYGSSMNSRNTKYMTNQSQVPISCAVSAMPQPLAFKNPLYQKNSSLTSSSSEEEHSYRMEDLISPPLVNSGIVATITSKQTNRLNDSFGGLNGRRFGGANNNRAPRTNPMMHVRIFQDLQFKFINPIILFLVLSINARSRLKFHQYHIQTVKYSGTNVV